MAILHRATLTPSKLELLQAWLPGQAWSGVSDPESLVLAGAYRFDDPAGAVGVEVHLIDAGNRVLQVPVTYRAAPFGESAELGRLQHSALGERWVYPGWHDPVFAQTLTSAIRSGGRQADLLVLTDDGPVLREPTTTVRGSGNRAPTPAGLLVTAVEDGENIVMRYGETQTTLLRVLGSAEAPDRAETLTGRWPGHDEPALLAYLIE